MWNCNGSASLAVFPERRVLFIVTGWAAADHLFPGLFVPHPRIVTEV